MNNTQQHFQFVSLSLFSFKKLPENLQIPFKNFINSVSNKSTHLHPHLLLNNCHLLPSFNPLFNHLHHNLLRLINHKKKNLSKMSRRRKLRRKDPIKNKKNKVRQEKLRRRERKWATSQKLHLPVFYFSLKTNKAVSLRPILHMEWLS